MLFASNELIVYLSNIYANKSTFLYVYRQVKHTKLLRIIRNAIGFHRKETGPPRIIVDNNIGHFINPQNMLSVIS